MSLLRVFRINNLISNSIKRNISKTFIHNKIENKKSDNSSLDTIYQFPYIRAASAINKLKVIQAAITTICVPFSVILQQLQMIDVEMIYVTAAVGFSGTVAFLSVGYIATNLVGFIYVNSTKDILKIAYVDFWGRRKDSVIAVKDIVPLSELPVMFTDPVYLTIRNYKDKNTLKLILATNSIVNNTKFLEVFGEPA